MSASCFKALSASTLAAGCSFARLSGRHSDGHADAVLDAVRTRHGSGLEGRLLGRVIAFELAVVIDRPALAPVYDFVCLGAHVATNASSEKSFARKKFPLSSYARFRTRERKALSLFSFLVGFLATAFPGERDEA